MHLNLRAARLGAALLLTSPLFAAELPNPTLDETKVLAQAQEAQNRSQPEKRAFIERQLTLTPRQAEKFWPIYDEHQAALGELNRRRVENILLYARAINQGSVDDKTANALARELIAIEEDEVRSRRGGVRALLAQELKRLDAVPGHVHAVDHARVLQGQAGQIDVGRVVLDEQDVRDVGGFHGGVLTLPSP